MKDNKAFTLIILIITIVIMIILASISISDMKDTQIIDKAKELTVMTNQTYQNEERLESDIINDIM